MLSKSKIMAGLQCTTKLWLSLHQKHLGVISPQQRLVMQRGDEFGTIARDQYPGGILISALNSAGKVDVANALLQTEQLMKQFAAGEQRVPLYEATFKRDDTIVMVDILLPQDHDAWKIIEVKSGKAKDGDLFNERYVMDAAIQTYVANNSIKVHSTALGFPNPDFTYTTFGKYDDLLKVEDISILIDDKLNAIPSMIADLTKVAHAPEMPIPVISSKCKGCEFIQYCSKTEILPGESIRVPVWYLGSSPEVSLVQDLMKSERDLAKVPANRLSKKIHLEMREVAKSADRYIDTKLVSHLENQAWPRYFLDFEYLGKAVPLWLGTKTNDSIPFQFSLHKWTGPTNQQITHVEFISDSIHDPRKSFIAALLEALDDDGPIYTWHGNSVEGPITRKLSTFATPAEKLKLEKIAQSCQEHDLLKVFKHYFYVLGMHGWSIKEISKNLLSSNPYASMSTSNGVEAMTDYERFLLMENTIERDNLKKHLLAYCKVDTGVMIDIWKKVLELGSYENVSPS